MWLLDVNIDVQLVQVLSELGVRSESAVDRGWRDLSNGDLVSAAAGAGFTCLLTRDQRIGESASRALKAFPRFAVVVVDLPQYPRGKYQQEFLSAWRAGPIEPAMGHLLRWPHAKIK